jgi:SAM-dependent methyltransferase
MAHQVRFHLADAERLPFDDETFDVVICECAFCTFPDKPTAAAEIARVLRPGGRVGITDITLDPTRLDPQLAGLAGWIACIADARPADEYTTILRNAGLHTTLTESHDDALTGMIDMIEARIRALRIARSPALEGLDLPTVQEMTAVARDMVRQQIAGYTLLIAHKARSR